MRPFRRLRSGSPKRRAVRRPADPNLRTPEWLRERYLSVMSRCFPELSSRDDVVVRFGRRCRRRLGSLRLKDGLPLITLNGLFRLPEVPEPVVENTLAHELAHLFHGCLERRPRGRAAARVDAGGATTGQAAGSDTPAAGKPLYRYPHRGGVVDKELAKRGMSETAALSKSWIQAHWLNLCARELT